MLLPFGCNFVLTLSTGMFCGFFSFYLLNSSLTIHPHYFEGYSYEDHAHSHKDIEDAAGPENDVQIHSPSEMYHKGENDEAKKLAEKVRVLCWVMTNPKNHEKKAKHVKATWAQRCNKILFISSVEDKSLGSIALHVPEGRDHLWDKTKGAFKYIYDHHLDEADWFMKADDDTYVVVENLRYMLSNYDPSLPLWFGCRFKKFVKQGYMSGGAGYVLSREAVKKLVEDGLPNPRKCRSDGGGSEDVEIGKCLENVGVKALDSRDNLGRYRFFPFVAEHHLIPGHIGPKNWFWDYIFYPSKVGMDCCSDTAISFHYVPPNKMYELEYFIYHLRPYGVQPRIPFPAPLPPDKLGIPQELIEKLEGAEKAEEEETPTVPFRELTTKRPLK